MKRPVLFSRGTWPEAARVADLLRRESVGGLLLLTGALTALLWANSPWATGYFAISNLQVGPASWGLRMDLAHWASDGLLAIFFFAVGLELKREFVAGDLRDPRRAALPIVAAVAGMAIPALVFVAVTLPAGGGRVHGWAIPSATDIAFAVAVLALMGSYLPIAMRTFLLTLAVVDDLLGIAVIALFYSSNIAWFFLASVLLPVVTFCFVTRRGWHSGWLLTPIALITWYLMLQSGVHATISGVLLGFMVPVRATADPRYGEHGPAEHFEHRIRPISTGVAVPVFAFFAAGVNLIGEGLGSLLVEPVTIGIALGLIVGKPIGILGGSWLLARFTRANLDPSIKWIDVLGIGMLAGVGFTVSLLIGDLAFKNSTHLDDAVKIGVITGSVLAAVFASFVLRARNRAYAKIELEETLDENRDGIPDVFQRGDEE